MQKKATRTSPEGVSPAGTPRNKVNAPDVNYLPLHAHLAAVKQKFLFSRAAIALYIAEIVFPDSVSFSELSLFSPPALLGG